MCMLKVIKLFHTQVFFNTLCQGNEKSFCCSNPQHATQFCFNLGKDCVYIALYMLMYYKFCTESQDLQDYSGIIRYEKDVYFSPCILYFKKSNFNRRFSKQNKQ